MNSVYLSHSQTHAAEVLFARTKMTTVQSNQTQTGNYFMNCTFLNTWRSLLNMALYWRWTYFGLGFRKVPGCWLFVFHFVLFLMLFQ